MKLVTLHPDTGRPLLIRTQQAVVYNDDGRPVAVTYEHAGLIVHTDASQDDFIPTCRQLRIESLS